MSGNDQASDEDTHRLILFGRYIDWGEAQIVRGYLESNGVDCLVADGHAGTFDGSVMIGGFRLLVPADQEARARSLVKDVAASAKSTAETCPRCGGEEVGPVGRPKPGIIELIFGAGVRDRQGMRQCRNCDHRWQPD